MGWSRWVGERDESVFRIPPPSEAFHSSSGVQYSLFSQEY